MSDLIKMQRGVLRELKNVRRFFDNMERSVKNGNSESIQKAYMFLMHLVTAMDEGMLTPNNIALDLKLARILQENCEIGTNIRENFKNA